MLPNALWQELHLVPEDVAQRAFFFAAYSRAKAVGPDVRELIALSERADSPETGLMSFGNPPGETGGREVEVNDEGTRRPLWIEAGEEGDACREAALAALLLGTGPGLDHLRRAARAYNHANPPYGLFLAGLAPGALESPGQQAARLLADQSGRTQEEGQRVPLLSPAQQIHLMLAVMSAEEAPVEFVDIDGYFAELPAAKSATAFGTAGAPLAEWWSFAVGLLRLGNDLPGERDWLRDRIASLAAPHGRQLDRAQLDRHHWRNLHSSVDLLDLDLAGSLCLANRRLEVHGNPLSEDDFADTPPLARVSIAVGLQMTRPEPESVRAVQI